MMVSARVEFRFARDTAGYGINPELFLRHQCKLCQYAYNIIRSDLPRCWQRACAPLGGSPAACLQDLEEQKRTKYKINGTAAGPQVLVPKLGLRRLGMCALRWETRKLLRHCRFRFTLDIPCEYQYPFMCRYSTVSSEQLTHKKTYYYDRLRVHVGHIDNISTLSRPTHAIHVKSPANLNILSASASAHVITILSITSRQCGFA